MTETEALVEAISELEPTEIPDAEFLLIELDIATTPDRIKAVTSFRRQLIQIAAANARNAALEEAAKVADEYLDRWRNAAGFTGHSAAAVILRDEIRNLKSTPQ